MLILLKIALHILNYLDDLAGAEKKVNAAFAYCCLDAVLAKYGIDEDIDKACSL